MLSENLAVTNHALGIVIHLHNHLLQRIRIVTQIMSLREPCSDIIISNILNDASLRWVTCGTARALQAL